MRPFRLQVHQVKKTKNNLSKIDKSKRQKNRSKQSRGDRETERRPLEKNTCFVVGMRRCGRRDAEHGESFSGRSKEEDGLPQWLNGRSKAEEAFWLMRRG